MPNGKELREKLHQAIMPASLSRFIPGNQVTLLHNGEAYFPAIEAAFDRARHEIYLETYIYENNATGQRIAESLKRATLRGVKVYMLIDGYGSKDLPRSFIKIFEGRNAVEIASFDRVTIGNFGEDELTFIAKHAADFSVNLDGIWKALIKARPGGRVKEDALNILFTAFSIVMQQYEITVEDQLKLSNFFTEKYRGLPPLHNLSPGNL